MRHYAGLAVVLGTTLFGYSARAAEHASEPSALRTQSVAVFPDVTPGPPPAASFQDVKPPPPPDPSLELLASNPYDAQLAAALAAQNLYGDELANPYVEEARLANPYTDELRFQNPYAQPALAKREAPNVALSNPYSALLRPANANRSDASTGVIDFTNPYQGALPPPRAYRVVPAAPGTLVIDARPGAWVSAFVDGVGVMVGVALPVLPGPHVVTVYPAGSPPFSMPVYVGPGLTQRVRVGP
jgi:hypothetical protein